MMIMCKYTYTYTPCMYVSLGSIHTTDKDLEFNSKKKDNMKNISDSVNILTGAEIDEDGKLTSSVDSQREGTDGLKEVSNGDNVISDSVEANHDENTSGNSKEGDGAVIIDDEGTVTIEANRSSSIDMEIVGAEKPKTDSATLQEEGVSGQMNIIDDNSASAATPIPQTDTSNISTTIKNNDETSPPTDNDPRSSDNQGTVLDSKVDSTQGENMSAVHDVFSMMGVSFSIKSR
jgi:hypothetical protein